MFSTQAYQSYRNVQKDATNSPTRKLRFLQDEQKLSSNFVSLSMNSLHEYYKNHFQDCIKPPLAQFFILPQLKNNQVHNQTSNSFQYINIEKMEIDPHSDNESKFDYFLEDQAIFYCQSGSLQLMLKQQSQNSQNQQIRYRKIADIKQENYFTMINYKNLTNKYPEYLKMIPKSKCEIGKILINKAYGYEWLQNEYKKLSFLTSILYYNEQNVKELRRFPKLKQFACLIKEENYRRDMFISFQQKQRPFEKIYFLQEGECVYYKQINHIKKGISNKQNIQICKAKRGAILNGELLLQQNQKFYELIQSFQTQKVQNEQKNEQEAEGQSSQLTMLKKSFGKIFSLKDLKKYSEQKGVLRNNNQIVFYYPIQNVSNFSIKASSSNVKLYSVSVKTLFKHINESMKDNLLNYCQDFYVSLVRRTIEKFDQFISINAVLDQRQNQSHKTLQGLLQGQELHKIKKVKQNSGIQLKKSQMQINSNENYINLKNAKIALKRTNNLNKKISILIKNKEKKSNINYKEKIQEIIISNLKNAHVYKPALIQQFQSQRNNQIKPSTKKTEKNVIKQSIKNNYNSTPTPPIKESMQNQEQSTQKVQFFAENFEDIFMKVKQNRSQGVLRHNDILIRKQKLFNKRYQKQKQFQLFIDQDKLLPQKNRKVSIELRMKGHPKYQQTFNYLKGVQIQDRSDSIKISLQDKINKTNRVKQQFMKIHSQCKQCHCYDDIQLKRSPSRQKANSHHPHRSSTNFTNYESTKDPKYHTMKIGVNWRSQKMFKQDQPLQSIYRRIKIVNQKNKQKYRHGAHLFERKKQLMSRERRASAPIFSTHKI